MKNSFIILFAFVILGACSSEEERYTPKRFGELRVTETFAAKDYQTVKDVFGANYSLPQYAQLKLKQKNDSICNYQIDFPERRATLYMTLLKLNGDLQEKIEQSNKITHQHLIKADDFRDTLLLFPEKRVYSQVYNLIGNVASNIQFVCTDSTENLLRGALYFNVAPNYDSLVPAIDYIKEDIYHLIKTLEWQKSEQ